MIQQELFQAIMRHKLQAGIIGWVIASFFATMGLMVAAIFAVGSEDYPDQDYPRDRCPMCGERKGG